MFRATCDFKDGCCLTIFVDEIMFGGGVVEHIKAHIVCHNCLFRCVE